MMGLRKAERHAVRGRAYGREVFRYHAPRRVFPNSNRSHIIANRDARFPRIRNDNLIVYNRVLVDPTANLSQLSSAFKTCGGAAYHKPIDEIRTLPYREVFSVPAKFTNANHRLVNGNVFE